MKYKVLTLNSISAKGLDRLPRDRYQVGSGIGDPDAILVRSVDELHYDAIISDPTWNTLARRFNTHQMMDIVFTVGAYKMLAMALNSFGTQLDRDMSGFQ